MVNLIEAEAYGLPFLPAYLNLTKDHDIKKGVNFAFAGATAIDFEYFKLRGVQPATNYSLSVQLGWFKKFKPSLCKSKQGLTITPWIIFLYQIHEFSVWLTQLCYAMTECESFFKKSLFIVGEIGGNDVGSFLSHKNITELREMVPLLVETITNTTDVCNIKFKFWNIFLNHKM